MIWTYLFDVLFIVVDWGAINGSKYLPDDLVIVNYQTLHHPLIIYKCTPIWNIVASSFILPSYCCRLLECSFLLFQALIDSTSSESDLEDEIGVRMVALFDHEEVGSDSAQGAGSPAMLDALSRITNSFCSNSKVGSASCPFLYFSVVLNIYDILRLQRASYRVPSCFLFIIFTLHKSKSKAALQCNLILNELIIHEILNWFSMSWQQSLADWRFFCSDDYETKKHSYNWNEITYALFGYSLFFSSMSSTNMFP